MTIRDELKKIAERVLKDGQSQMDLGVAMIDNAMDVFKMAVVGTDEECAVTMDILKKECPELVSS